MWLSETQGPKDPEILVISVDKQVNNKRKLHPSPHPPIMVFGGAQYMCNSLNTVDNRTGKIISRVDPEREREWCVSSDMMAGSTSHILVLGASAGVGLQLAAVEGRITHTSIVRLVVYHST